jgi:hypothetical protein
VTTQTTTELDEAARHVAATVPTSRHLARRVLEFLLRVGWIPPWAITETSEPLGWMVVEPTNDSGVRSAWDGIVHATRADAEAELHHANTAGDGPWMIVAAYEPTTDDRRTI